MSDSTGTESPGAPTGQPSAPSNRRRPIPRKGHKKSRTGCATCKRRKVKCDESTPECGICRRLGLTCVYERKQGNDIKPEVPPSIVARPLQTTPTVFDMDDMRFFHHFIFEAYPSLPIDGFSTWQGVTRLSHEYDFLLHAMLGLGASHLSLISPEGYEKAALRHRVGAIKSLNEHLSKPNLSTAAAEAVFGSMLSLVFQSAYMQDGMTDFFTLVRGCFLVSMHAIRDFDATRFGSMTRASYIVKIRELSLSDEASQDIESIAAKEFHASIERLAPLCKTTLELEFLEHMRKISKLAMTDPAESYRDIAYLWDRLGDFTSTDFASFIDPNNYASRIVIVHILALDFVFSRKVVKDADGDPTQTVDLDAGPQASLEGFGCHKSISKLWIAQIVRELPKEYHEYVKWPVSFVAGSMYTFDRNDQVWVPFMLSRGKMVWSTTNSPWPREPDTTSNGSDTRVLSLRPTPTSPL